MDAKIENGGLQENEGWGYGKSLPVPSVQKIARQDPLGVPERYIREEKDRTLERLYFKTVFTSLQLTNHGVAEEVLQKMKAAVAAFYELPLEEKKKDAMAPNDLQGYGQRYVVSEEQKLAWNDLIVLITHPPEFKNTREAVEHYTVEICNVAKGIFTNLSLLMEMKKDGLMQLHRVLTLVIRMNCYPTCSRPDLVLGVSPHSDASSLTLLLQDDETTGLQIRYKEGWIPVKPIPNALVVNIGDVMEGWSSGVYKSIKHRAKMNERAARISIAAFVLPNDEVDIGPVATKVVHHDCPGLYKHMKYVDYIRYTLARKMDGKAKAEFLKAAMEGN